MELVGRANVTLRTQLSFPLGLTSVVDDDFRLFVGDWMAELLHFTACIGESIGLLIARDPTVEWNPLSCDG